MSYTLKTSIILYEFLSSMNGSQFKQYHNLPNFHENNKNQ